MATTEFFKKADPIVISILGKLKTNRDKKFPYNWIGMKLKKKWDPEIVLQVLDDIDKSPLPLVREPWKYFETVWATNAQNYRSAQITKAEKKDAEEILNGYERLAGLVGKVVKEI